MNNEQATPSTLVAMDEGLATTQQIGMLLSVCATIAPFVLEQHRDAPHQRKELDGGVAASVETLMVTTCDRLEAIIKDEPRWKYNAQAADAKRELFLANLHANRQLLALQATNIAESLRPCKEVDSIPVQISPGVWVLCDGPIKEWWKYVVGIGNSPAQACLDYDFRFAGQPANSLLLLEAQFPEPKRKRS
jgi:hypothetical protein